MFNCLLQKCSGYTRTSLHNYLGYLVVKFYVWYTFKTYTGLKVQSNKTGIYIFTIAYLTGRNLPSKY